MKATLKIFALSLVGAVLGFGIWATFYLIHKTPAIEFDGPAGGGMIASTGLGFIVFAIVGIILRFLKKF